MPRFNDLTCSSPPGLRSCGVSFAQTIPIINYALRNIWLCICFILLWISITGTIVYINSSAASLAPASPTMPMQQMRKEQSPQKGCACCNLCPTESLKQHFRSKVMDGFMSGSAFNCSAVRHRPSHSDMGLIKQLKMNKYSRAQLPVKVTLLAASTLAQMASMAALSSRRRAFFSFALLDFLWEIKEQWMIK